MALKTVVVLVFLCSCVYGQLCPRQCDCDVANGLNRATCEGQNIISMEVGVPSAVQVYSLSHNLISGLENYCFKEAGITSIEVLNLSYNQLSWIGIHAFAGLDRLVHLDLSSNRLRAIVMDLFYETPLLEMLDLSGNVFEELKNQPLMEHAKLKVLNLNNCRIKSLPDRIFTRLPNLRKLDLSENYMISLNTEVLKPLRKLERLELRNDYWNCDPSFIAVEAWITSHQISYTKKCTKRTPKMFEKMISAAAPTVEQTDVDVKDVWNITEKNETLPALKPSRELTWYEKLDKEFSSSQAFIIGLELGTAIGIVVTYVWLRSLCDCRRMNCTRPQTRRQRRRAQRVDSDMRTNLLWNSGVYPDLETPPPYRRQVSLPDRSPPMPYGVPGHHEPIIHADAIRVPVRGETPPPPYHECRINI